MQSSNSSPRTGGERRTTDGVSSTLEQFSAIASRQKQKRWPNKLLCCSCWVARPDSKISWLRILTFKRKCPEPDQSVDVRQTFGWAYEAARLAESFSWWCCYRFRFEAPLPLRQFFVRRASSTSISSIASTGSSVWMMSWRMRSRRCW